MTVDVSGTRLLISGLLAAFVALPSSVVGQETDGPATSRGDERTSSPASESADETEAPPENDPSAPSDDASTSARKSDAESTGAMSLTDAVDIAVERNHGLRIARRRIDISARNYSIGNAGFLPTVDAGATQQHVFGGTGLFGNPNIRTSTEFGVNLEWTILDGLKRFWTYDRLENEFRVSELRERADVEATLQEVTTGYWEIVRQKQLVAALRETVAVSETRLEIARGRKEAGVGSVVDVNQAKVQLNQDRSDLAEQQIAVTEAKTNLNRTLGRQADEEFDVDGTIRLERDLDYASLRERTLERNPRLVQLEQQKNVARLEVGEAKADRWPRLDLGLGYNYTEYHAGVAPEFDTVPALQYTLDLTVPIFRARQIDRRIDNARSRRNITDLEFRRERVRVIGELKNAYTSYQRHLERVELAEGTVETARENVDVALTRLEVGTITQVELRQVQLDLLDARNRLVDAKYRAKTAEIRLRRLAGRLYDDWL